MTTSLPKLTLAKGILSHLRPHPISLLILTLHVFAEMRQELSFSALFYTEAAGTTSTSPDQYGITYTYSNAFLTSPEHRANCNASTSPSSHLCLAS